MTDTNRWAAATGAASDAAPSTFSTSTVGLGGVMRDGRVRKEKRADRLEELRKRMEEADGRSESEVVVEKKGKGQGKKGLWAWPRGGML